MLDSNDECPHTPNWMDKVLYYFHIIVEPCRFTGPNSDFLILPCLVTDWVEQGLACPTCLIDDEGDYLTVHPCPHDE